MSMIKSLGYVPPQITANLSIASSSLRAAAIAANLSAYELPTKPRNIVSQQDVPCCVSCALSAALECIHPAWQQLAPLFHYYVTRYDNAGADSNGFLSLETAIGTLTNQGICQLSLHPLPYTIHSATIKPSMEAYTDGVNHRLTRRGLFFQYRKFSGPSRVTWIREELKKNCPVVIGMRLPVGYPNLGQNKNFEWQDPSNPPPSESSHCVVLLGYNDARQAMRVQDSQGTEIFDGGFWWLGYRVVDSLAIDEAFSFVP